MIQYLNNLILPDRYILKNNSGRVFESIEAWVKYEKATMDKRRKRRYMKALPYITIINMDKYEYNNWISDDMTIALNHISKSAEKALLYFAVDFSKIVFEKFLFAHDEICLDFDMYYGGIRLDTSIPYTTKFKKLSRFIRYNGSPIRVVESYGSKTNNPKVPDFSYAYCCYILFVDDNKAYHIELTPMNNNGEFPIYCLKPYTKSYGYDNAYRVNYVNHGYQYSDIYIANSEDEAISLCKTGYSDSEDIVIEEVNKLDKYF